MNDITDKFRQLISDLEQDREVVVEKLRKAKSAAFEGWDKIEKVFEEEKNIARVKGHLLKLDLFEGWDKVVEKLEEHAPDKRELLARMHLARAEALEEWDEIEEKLAALKDKAESLVSSSEEKLEAAWDTGKIMGKEIKLLLQKISNKGNDS